jgi:hypothetical protein
MDKNEVLLRLRQACAFDALFDIQFEEAVSVEMFKASVGVLTDYVCEAEVSVTPEEFDEMFDKIEESAITKDEAWGFISEFIFTALGEERILQWLEVYDFVRPVVEELPEQIFNLISPENKEERVLQ